MVEPSERACHDAMAPHVAETLVSGLYDVVYTMQSSAEGAHTIVPLTERHLKPGTMDDHQTTMKAFTESMGGPPPGMVEMMAMTDTADGDHLIQFGILRTDDPGGLSSQDRGGREQMVERIAPFVESVGIDTTFEMVEELTPSHA